MGFKDFMNNQWPDQCMGCSVGNGDMLPPGGIIYDTKNFVLHQDPDVPLSGFLIVAAKKHIRSIEELTLEESTEFFQLVYKARVAMKKVCDINEITIIQEERSGHLHLWLLPRYQWMNEKFGNSLSNIREIMSYTKENLKTESNLEEVLLVTEKLKVAFSNNLL
ncbi:HIT family protein [Clostridium sp. UBA4548]|uniref:HIT family protein n=1 Tax=Clostridium sp. UBA4548 TaxID=1946361 RepID=UPI0025C26C10|nr:HIT domain-containing protein [Clostridium sp. UBA4548]